MRLFVAFVLFALGGCTLPEAQYDYDLGNFIYADLQTEGWSEVSESSASASQRKLFHFEKASRYSKSGWKLQIEALNPWSLEAHAHITDILWRERANFEITNLILRGEDQRPWAEGSYCRIHKRSDGVTWRRILTVRIQHALVVMSAELTDVEQGVTPDFEEIEVIFTSWSFANHT